MCLVLCKRNMVLSLNLRALNAPNLSADGCVTLRALQNDAYRKGGTVGRRKAGEDRGGEQGRVKEGRGKRVESRGQRGKGVGGQGAEQGGETLPHRLCSECSAVGPPSNLDLTYRAGLLQAGLLPAEAYALFVLLVIICKASPEATQTTWALILSMTPCKCYKAMCWVSPSPTPSLCLLFPISVLLLLLLPIPLSSPVFSLSNKPLWVLRKDWVQKSNLRFSLALFLPLILLRFCLE